MRPLHPLIAALFAAVAIACAAPTYAQSNDQQAPSARTDAAPSLVITNSEHHYTLTLPTGWSALDPALLEQINTRARAADPDTQYHAAYLPDAQPESGSVYVLMQFIPGILAAQTLNQIDATIVATMAESFPPVPNSATTHPFHAAHLDRSALRITQRAPLQTPDPQTPNTSPSPSPPPPPPPTHQPPYQIAHSVGVLGAEGILWAHAYLPPDAPPQYQSGIDALATSMTFSPAYTYFEPSGPSSAPPPGANTPPHTRSGSSAILAGVIVGALVFGLIAVALRKHTTRPAR